MIGLRFNQIKNGDDVYYYSWLNKETGDHPEPIKTTCRSDPFPIDQKSNGCSEGIFINGISGYVFMSHLSKDYFPEKITPPKTEAQEKYDYYLSSEYSGDFSDFLGIEKPKFEYNRDGLVRMVSRKYSNVTSGYFRFKKDAKADYKIKLKAFKSRK